MMSLHSSMHSSQMYTPGPAISFFTCFCDLPQKLHFTRSPPSPNFATSVPLVLLSVVPVAHPCVLLATALLPDAASSAASLAVLHLRRGYTVPGARPPTPQPWRLGRLRRASVHRTRPSCPRDEVAHPP